MIAYVKLPNGSKAQVLFHGGARTCWTMKGTDDPFIVKLSATEEAANTGLIDAAQNLQETDLADYKQTLIAKAEGIFEFINYQDGFLFEGSYYPCTERVRSTLNMALHRDRNTGYPLKWYDENYQARSFASKGDLRDLLEELAVHTGMCYEALISSIGQIMAAPDEAALEKIDLTLGWPPNRLFV